jgi:hypothetical protein
MTKYTITIVTFKCGMSQKFEFATMGARDCFISMFVNGLIHSGDYVINLTYGERTFAA